MSSSSGVPIYDVFVGNVTSSTNEEQLRSIFEWIGPVKNVRIQIDRDTGRTKGFAFIEFNDANSALAAIRHMDGHELQGRKLRVSFSANSTLRDIARESGIAIPDAAGAGARSEYQTIANMQLYEVWDLVDAVKKMVDEDKSNVQVRAVFEAYPLLVGALLEAERRLGIASTSSSAASAGMAQGSALPYPAPTFQHTQLAPPPFGYPAPAPPQPAVDINSLVNSQYYAMMTNMNNVNSVPQQDPNAYGQQQQWAYP